MHKFNIPEIEAQRAVSRCGRAHMFDTLAPARTALVVIDMQNYFLAPGEQGEIPMAREIVPTVNRLAESVRAAGAHVVWVQNSTNDTRESWSVLHDDMLTPAWRARRWKAMDESGSGHLLWPALEPKPWDGRIIKKRFSAFIQGASNIESYLRGRGIDTVLIAGTATNGCCESSARDAMMLNFRTVMVSDANATTSDELHAAALISFFVTYGDVLTADEVIVALARGNAQHARIA
jgi:ureidoacrylate peracid hydrolase